MSRKNLNFQWLNHVENLLNNSGMSYIWQQQSFSNCESLKLAYSLNLKDQLTQNWQDEIKTMSKCQYYQEFKPKHCFEDYLILLPSRFRVILCRFRCRNHRLTIETGTYNGTPRNERICLSCNNAVGDEYHYLLVCPNFQSEREKYLRKFYWYNHNLFKFRALFCQKGKELINLCKFINIINQSVKGGT